MSEATVPLNPEAVAPLSPGPDARVVGPARILIVDDEAAIRESLDALLSMEGINVTTAADGPLGLEQLSAGEFDLLLLDLALPGGAGWTLTGIDATSADERGRALPRLAEVPA